MNHVNRVASIIGWVLIFLWMMGCLDIIDVSITVKPHLERVA